MLAPRSYMCDRLIMASIDALLDGPWSIGIEDEAPLSVIVVAHGSAVFTGADGQPQQLVPGDVVLARGPDHYTIADRAGRPDDIRILPGQVCVDPEGRVLPE